MEETLGRAIQRGIPSSFYASNILCLTKKFGNTTFTVVMAPLDYQSLSPYAPPFAQSAPGKSMISVFASSHCTKMMPKYHGYRCCHLAESAQQ